MQLEGKYAIYGAGEVGREAYVVISSSHGSVSCWVDGNPAKQGKELYGKPIKAIEEWQNGREGRLLIASNSKNRAQIEAKLKSLRITDYEVFDRKLFYDRERLISYARESDLEDIILYNVLKNEEAIENIFYIDAGCNDPSIDSVTKFFYDRGACGINIDPLEEYVNCCRRERPRDINLCFALGEQKGIINVFLDGALTTACMVENVAISPESKREVPMRPLSSICEAYVPSKQDIHILKIDVEGFEAQVIKGMNWQRWRPWLLCVEATTPLTDEASHVAWESLLLQADYSLAFVYGANRYYVAMEKKELREKFLPVHDILEKYRVYHANAVLLDLQHTYFSNGVAF